MCKNLEEFEKMLIIIVAYLFFLSASPPSASTPTLNLVKMKDVTVEEGDSATFQTEIIGFQPQHQGKLKVQWFRENALIPESEDFEVSQRHQTLAIFFLSHRKNKNKLTT